LHNIIKNSIPEATSSVGNSFRLVNALNGKILELGCTLASLDVVALFTNVPIEYAYVAISDRWDCYHSYFEEFLIVSKYVNYFQLKLR